MKTKSIVKEKTVSKHNRNEGLEKRRKNEIKTKTKQSLVFAGTEITKMAKPGKRKEKISFVPPCQHCIPCLHSGCI